MDSKVRKTSTSIYAKKRILERIDEADDLNVSDVFNQTAEEWLDKNGY